MYRLTQDRAARLGNPELTRYARRYSMIEERLEDSMRSYGLGIAAADEPASSRILALQERGACVENDGKSLSVNWISPSCIACRKALATETFLISTLCPRACYFCFNPNQGDYERGLTSVNDVSAELRERFDKGVHYEHLALSGGEPLLHEEEAVAFFEAARRLYPSARTRLYTSGYGATPELLSRLAHAGLDEIRFSIKLEDEEKELEKTLFAIAASTRLIGCTMVEMPIAPDQISEMKELLLALDSLGVQGVNLLEICFPFHNAEEFARRGYQLKRRPYRVPYDYWYAGGLPIAGSERVCLDLLEFALEAKLKMGVHYCSLENKLTGQIYQQNLVALRSPAVFPLHEMSPKDHFLRSAKVFGEDILKAAVTFERTGIASSLNEELGFLEFPVSDIGKLADEHPDMPVVVSICIAESREGELALRELALDITTPRESARLIEV